MAPFPSASCHANDLGRSKGREAVHQCDADVDFGGLAFRVSCCDAFTEGLQAPHLDLDPASDMVSCTSLPERPAIVLGGTQGFVSGDCGGAVRFPGSTVLADRNDRGGLAVDDGGVTAAGVIGTIGGQGADVFVLGDLVEQFRQFGGSANSPGGGC